MRKIKSIFIVSILLFNLSASLPADVLRMHGNVGSFDISSFVAEEMQNVFESVLTHGNSGQTSQNKAEKQNSYSINTNVFSQFVIFKKASNCRVCTHYADMKEDISFDSGFLSNYKTVFLRSGLTGYEMRLNSYIAEIVPNNDLFIFTDKNSKG